MSEVLKTVNASLLKLVGQGVEVLPALVIAGLILVMTRFVERAVRRLVRATVDRFIHNLSLQLLFLQLTSVAVWAGGILLACAIAFPDLGLGDIIALLGLSSVAIGFAFQDIFKNFLAGVLLLLNEPFKVRDQIVVGDYEGTVESISIRATEIRTYQNELVVIPNAMVFTSPVQVLTNYPARRTDLGIGLDYNTPLPEARQTLLRALTQVEGVLADPAPEVDLVGFGDSSIDFMVRYWTASPIAQVRRTKSHVVMALKQACDQADFSIPYPIRSVYFFDQDRYTDHTPNAIGQSATSN